MAVAAQEVSRREPRTRSSRIVRFISKTPVHIFLILVALFWLTPTVGLLVTGFRPAAEITASGWWNAITDPAQLTFANYTSILDREGMVRSLLNTFYITIPTTVLLVIVAAAAAYAFSWIEFKGREVLFLVVIALLVVPLQMALIPMARLFGDLNLFIGLPHELLEAARIDGASEWQIFSRIVLPLGMPAIAALAIFQFLWTWNDLLVGLVFTARDNTPITVFIR